jgi:hypothetical protein
MSDNVPWELLARALFTGSDCEVGAVTEWRTGRLERVKEKSAPEIFEAGLHGCWATIVWGTACFWPSSDVAIPCVKSGHNY